MRVDPRFVGRDEELHSFEQMLENPWSNSRLKFVWGPGGIGKTWLIKEMLKMAQKHPKGYKVPVRVLEIKEKTTDGDDQKTEVTVIDMYATRNRHLEGVIESIIEQLGLPKDTLVKYQEEKERLLQARQQKGYATQGIEARLSALAAAFRQELSQFVQQQPAVLAFDTFEHVQDTAIGRWILDDQGLQMPGLLCLIASRKLNPKNSEQPALGGLDEQQALNFYRRYVPSFWSDELSEKEKAYVLRLNERVQGNPLLLGLALLWLDDSDLSEEDWEKLSVPEFERRIASWLSPSSINRQGARFKMVDTDWQEPLRQTLVCVAYLNRRFTSYLLAQLIQAGYVHTVGVSQAEATTILWQLLNNNLPEFFYIKERPEGEIQLHDKLAEMLRIHVLPEAFNDPSGHRIRALADAVVTWYDVLIAQADDVPLQKAILQTEKLAYALRMDVIVDTNLPDRHDTDEAKLLKRLLSPDFKKANELITDYQRQRSDILNRLIVNQITPETVTQFPFREKYEICAALGTLALQIHDLRRTRDFWQQAVDVAKHRNNPELEIEAMLGLFYGTWPESLVNALEILREALGVAREKVGKLYPTILYWIGITYRRMQDLDEAIRWYEEALEAARQHGDKGITPTILNDMGYALLLIGEYGRASVRIDMASRIRKQNIDILEKQITTITENLDLSSDDQVKHNLARQKIKLEDQLEDATQQLGTSYNTLGELFRYTGALDRATGYYSEAFAIFKKLNAYYWQVQALHSRGDAHRRLSRNLFDQERIESSQRFDSLAYRDIHESLELCQKYGFVEHLARVHRRMGRLMHDRFFKTRNRKEQEDWLNQAMTYLSSCLQVAREQNNVLEEMEALLEIAFLGDDLARLYKQNDPGNLLTYKKGEEIENKYLSPLRQAIKEHQGDEQRIFHFYVFENLLKMEDAALAYESGVYDNALNLYLESFTGLAQGLGYGSERCRRHFGHLFENIRHLPTLELRKEWCEQFIEKWKSTPMDRGDAATVAEAHPDLFEQFELYLDIGFIFS